MPRKGARTEFIRLANVDGALQVLGPERRCGSISRLDADLVVSDVRSS